MIYGKAMPCKWILIRSSVQRVSKVVACPSRLRRRLASTGTDMTDPSAGLLSLRGCPHACEKYGVRREVEHGSIQAESGHCEWAGDKLSLPAASIKHTKHLRLDERYAGEQQ